MKAINSYKFEFSDGGKKLSNRPLQKRDCAVRALAIATHTDYDVVYDTLAGAGRECNRGFHLQKWLPKQQGVFGYTVEKLSFQAIRGESRMCIRQFIQDHQVGRYILRVSRHVIALIDGVVMDTFQSRPDKCVYTAFRLIDATQNKLEN